MLIQATAAARVAARLLRSGRGTRIEHSPIDPDAEPRISLVIPVLNERHRLSPCLEAAISLGPVVAEILVVDGGSTDGTQDLIGTFGGRDPRVRLLDASPVPGTWNGKAWGLQVGFERSAAALPWLLFLDADVRPRPRLAASLLAHADTAALDAFSVATLQDVAGPIDALLHPSMLATLVYRFGSPGRVFERAREVQANGQCFMARREALRAIGGFAVTRTSRCEDITIARSLVVAGRRVGFYEAGDLIGVSMYRDWRELWHGWPRSLPMRDQFTRVASLIGLCEVTLVQAAPLPLCALLALARSPAHGDRAREATGRRPHPATRRYSLLLQILLMLVRIGILVGTRRAYCRPRWTYWISPLLDVPVTCRLWASVVQRKQVWRGRTLLRGGIE